MKNVVFAHLNDGSAFPQPVNDAAVYVVFVALAFGATVCFWSAARRIVRFANGRSGRKKPSQVGLSIFIEFFVGLTCLAGIVTADERIVGVGLTSLATLCFFAYWTDRGSDSSAASSERPGPKFGALRSERNTRGFAIGFVTVAGLWTHFFVNAGHIATTDAKQSIVWAVIALTAAGAMILELIFDPAGTEPSQR